jgi:hypothetical protein
MFIFNRNKIICNRHEPKINGREPEDSLPEGGGDQRNL